MAFRWWVFFFACIFAWVWGGARGVYTDETRRDEMTKTTKTERNRIKKLTFQRYRTKLQTAPLATQCITTGVSRFTFFFVLFHFSTPPSICPCPQILNKKHRFSSQQVTYSRNRPSRSVGSINMISHGREEWLGMGVVSIFLFYFFPSFQHQHHRLITTPFLSLSLSLSLGT